MLKAAIAGAVVTTTALAGTAEAQVSFTGVSSNWSNSTCTNFSFTCNVDENDPFAGFNTIKYGTPIDSRIGFRNDGPTTAGFGEFFRIGTLGILNTADFNNILDTADLNLSLDFAAPDGLLAGLDFMANVSQNGLAPDTLDITPSFNSLITTSSSGKKYKVSVEFRDLPVEAKFLGTDKGGVFAKVEAVPEPALMLGLGSVAAAGFLAGKRSHKEEVA